MRMAEDILKRQLQAFAPRSILAVGEGADGLVTGYCARRPDCELASAGSPDAITALVASPPARRYDFGVMAGYLESVDKQTGGVLIARLRDVLVRRLCVVVPEEDPTREEDWTDADMTAFGFSLLKRVQDADAAFRIYGFDIASYKKTPDWLNPQHWAHPERWNKERW